MKIAVDNYLVECDSLAMMTHTPTQTKTDEHGNNSSNTTVPADARSFDADGSFVENTVGRKQLYRLLNLHGFTWYMYDSRRKLNCFRKQVGTQYALLRVTDKDIADGSAEDMAEEGITR